MYSNVTKKVTSKCQMN